MVSLRDRRGARAREQRHEGRARHPGAFPPGAERRDVHGRKLVLSVGLPGRTARQSGQEHSKGLSPHALSAGHIGKCAPHHYTMHPNTTPPFNPSLHPMHPITTPTLTHLYIITLPKTQLKLKLNA